METLKQVHEGRARGAPLDALLLGLAAYVVTDEAGVIRAADPAAAALLRAPARHLVGRSLRTLVVRSDHARLDILLRPRAGGLNDGATVRLVVPDGEGVRAEMLASPERRADGRVTGLRWRLRDLDAGARATREARAGARALAERGCAVLALDALGTVRWADAGATRLLGFDAADLLDRPLTGLLVRAEGDRRARPRSLDLTLRRGRKGRGRLSCRRADGAIAELAYVSVPCLDRDRVAGAILGLTPAD